MIDNCIALLNKERDDRVFRSYVANCLRAISENTAKNVSILSGGAAAGVYIDRSLSDILEPSRADRDDRSSEEIIEHIKERLQAIGGGEQ